MPLLLIGTSGWTYPSWKGSFYPEDCPRERFLAYYAREFPTTEVNSSFYHLPRAATYEQWTAQVPPEFVFALKVSRLITHHKRLVDVEEPWRAFVDRARVLGRHLGPLLLQFPPSFRCDRPRLARFLASACRPAASAPDPGATRSTATPSTLSCSVSNWFSRSSIVTPSAGRR